GGAELGDELLQQVAAFGQPWIVDPPLGGDYLLEEGSPGGVGEGLGRWAHGRRHIQPSTRSGHRLRNPGSRRWSPATLALAAQLVARGKPGAVDGPRSLTNGRPTTERGASPDASRARPLPAAAAAGRAERDRALPQGGAGSRRRRRRGAAGIPRASRRRGSRGEPAVVDRPWLLRGGSGGSPRRHLPRNHRA